LLKQLAATPTLEGTLEILARAGSDHDARA